LRRIDLVEVQAFDLLRVARIEQDLLGLHLMDPCMDAERNEAGWIERRLTESGLQTR
jgi:hypothetical protein